MQFTCSQPSDWTRIVVNPKAKRVHRSTIRRSNLKTETQQQSVVKYRCHKHLLYYLWAMGMKIYSPWYSGRIYLIVAFYNLYQFFVVSFNFSQPKKKNSTINYNNTNNIGGIIIREVISHGFGRSIHVITISIVISIWMDCFFFANGILVHMR